MFRSEGAFPSSSAFGYLNYTTHELDGILTTVQSNGAFSGTSAITGRSISGNIFGTEVTFTYNGSSHSFPIASSYGSTRPFAGVWTGAVVDSSLGAGFGEAIVSSQGQVFVIAIQDFSSNAGFGSISSTGSFSVPLLDGNVFSGVFPSPTYGRATGTFSLSDGRTETASLVRGVPSRLANISTRGFVGTGENVLIGGFIVSSGGKVVFVDAKGPSLASQGVSSPVQATQVTLYLGNQVIASNNGWRNNQNVAELEASGLAPTDDRESALQVALEPGAYTAVVSSGDGSTGIGLIEVFGVGDSEGP